MATKFKTLREFLYPQGKHPTFEIPDYQRGYKWAVKGDGDKPSSAEYLLSSMLDAWKNNPDLDFFLQGITVVEEGNRIEVIDGQQRITTLYLILRKLDCNYISNENMIDLQYNIRRDSGDFLRRIQENSFDWDSFPATTQDIYYFKAALRQIGEILEKQLESDGRSVFRDYLLNKVSFLYVVVNRSQAVSTFTMMNGNKATMHQDELVKAQMLHQVSIPVQAPDSERPSTFNELLEAIKDYAALDWEADALRSRYAREWDKWLYWWNRKCVQDFFHFEKRPMGLLLQYYCWGKAKKDKLDSGLIYARFKEWIGNAVAAKVVFKELRDLQKRFEDVFSNPLSHNYLKLALICNSSRDDVFLILDFFFQAGVNVEEMRKYAMWRLVGATHKEIVQGDTPSEALQPDIPGQDSSIMENRAREVAQKLSEDIVYGKYDEDAYRQLLRLNVEEYNKLNDGAGITFDFSIWQCRSLEHILPKSKVYHIEDRDGKQIAVRGDGMVLNDEARAQLMQRELAFKAGGSEHCIGNLVLLYKNNNSTFGDADFSGKKKIFFDMNDPNFSFASRNLLHSMSAFAEADWTPETIRKHRDVFLSRFRSDYGLN